MILKLLLALALLFLIVRAMKRLQSMPVQQRRAAWLKIALTGLAGVLLLGVITGRMHWIGAVFAALIPLLRFGTGTLLRFLPFWIRRTGGVASFRTDHLDVQIHVQQARITGRVTKGRHEGKAVETLTDTELAELEDDYKTIDLKSHYLIRLLRQRGNPSNDSRSAPPPFSNPARDEALQILGLQGQPNREEIIAAHRRLIQKLHPDRGGSDFLAARVNQAKDVLLDSL